MPITRTTVTLTTPAGHDVVAELDYDHFEVRRAQVVHHYTGIIQPLDGAVTDNLARALHARALYTQAVKESDAVDEKLKSFGAVIAALGESHPALAPYCQEMAQHRHIADDMCERAKYFHRSAMEAIDKMVED